MQAPDPIEEVLGRLMPRGLSDSGQSSIHSMLDELAATSLKTDVERQALAPEPARPLPRLLRLPRFAIAAGVAASLAAVIALGVDLGPKYEPIANAESLLSQSSSGLVFVGELDHIESMIDEGYLADPDGMALQAVRIRAVEENTFRDEATGVLVQVSEPREEILLTPVSAF